MPRPVFTAAAAPAETSPQSAPTQTTEPGAGHATLKGTNPPDEHPVTAAPRPCMRYGQRLCSKHVLLPHVCNLLPTEGRLQRPGPALRRTSPWACTMEPATTHQHMHAPYSMHTATTKSLPRQLHPQRLVTRPGPLLQRIQQRSIGGQAQPAACPRKICTPPALHNVFSLHGGNVTLTYYACNRALCIPSTFAHLVCVSTPFACSAGGICIRTYQTLQCWPHCMHRPCAAKKTANIVNKTLAQQ